MLLRRRATLLAVLAVTACGSSTHATPTPSPRAVTTATPTPTPTPTADPCVVPQQSPPTGNIGASFATALAFAPDGRLFYTERSGTVRVWQGGSSHVFASVRTVTTEAGGGYSERGLLGLAISPTFALDRYVFAFYSDANRTQQHVVRWRDCAGTGTGAAVIITLP
ncbi:MAG: PQQ-dependent sugar dehydrogenase, partial [Chloroflexi bacterium]